MMIKKSNVTFNHVHRYVHVNNMKTDSLSSAFAKHMHNTVQYSHCRGAEEPRSAPEPRDDNPCAEPKLYGVLDVLVSPVAAVSIPFSCPLETLPLCCRLYLLRVRLFAARSSICCAFVYLQRVCLFAARVSICSAFL